MHVELYVQEYLNKGKQQSGPTYTNIGPLLIFPRPVFLCHGQITASLGRHRHLGLLHSSLGQHGESWPSLAFPASSLQAEFQPANPRPAFPRLPRPPSPHAGTQQAAVRLGLPRSPAPRLGRPGRPRPGLLFSPGWAGLPSNPGWAGVPPGGLSPAPRPAPAGLRPGQHRRPLPGLFSSTPG
jgi:hypothetical protein